MSMSSLSVLKLCTSYIVTIFIFLMFKGSPVLSFSFFTFIRSCFISLLLSASKMVSCAYLKLLVFLSPIFTLSPYESSSVSHMICLAYSLNKQGDNMHLCLTSLPVRNHPVSPYSALTVASCPHYRCCIRTVRC